MGSHNFIELLEAALADPELGYGHLAMIEAERKYRQAKIVAESRTPTGGAFWFIPNGTDWEIISFFEEGLKRTDHSFMWSKYVAPLLMPNPPIKLKQAYAGLPRGRVVRQANGNFVIWHGNDLPHGDISIAKIAREFNLPNGRWVAKYNEYEPMLDDHFEVVKQALKYKAALSRPKSQWDQNDEEDDWDDDFDDAYRAG